jgi:hypothetical protein
LFHTLYGCDLGWALPSGLLRPWGSWTWKSLGSVVGQGNCQNIDMPLWFVDLEQDRQRPVEHQSSIAAAGLAL